MSIVFIIDMSDDELFNWYETKEMKKKCQKRSLTHLKQHRLR